jgi:hypothetical protein
MLYNLALEKIHESQDILEDIRRRIENSGYPNLYPVERGNASLLLSLVIEGKITEALLKYV